MTTDPSTAGIAPLWDDLECFSSGNGAVYWQVLGSGANQHLTLEWKDMHYYYNSPQLITFEAQLYADGRIQFNYQNLVGGTFNDNGASATVGLKDNGSQGPNRLLLDFNSGPNQYVNSNRSTLITPPNPTPDLYKFTASAGQGVTLALSGNGLNLDLLDGGGNLLASGVGGLTNLSKLLTNYVVAATGTYYVRITGASAVPYSLVVEKSGIFDGEPNDSPAQAQNLTGTQGALGAISASTVYQAQAITPTFEDITATGTPTLQGTDDSTNQLTPANLGGFQFSLYGTTYNTLFYSTNGLITFGSGNGEYFNQDMTSDPSQAAIAPLWDDLECFTSGNGAVYWQVLGTGANQHLTLEWKNMHYYYNSPQLITFEAQLYADGRIQFNYQNLVGGTFNDNGASASVGIKDAGTQGANRLLLDFNSGPNQYVGSNQSTLISQPSSDDWYKLTLTGDQRAIQLETSTPGDGPGEPGNTLNPHIQLYDASNNLIATGVPLADGRNESLRATGLTAGATYYARVSSEGGTTGEYFLGATALRVPTITVTVDNSSWSYHAYGAGWSTVAGGYGGTEQVHAGGGTGSNFAQWQYGQNVTAGNSYDIFTTWVAAPGNATNATYKIYDGATLLTTVTVDQTRSPNSGLVGSTLVQYLYTFTPATTGYHVIRVQLSDNANGTVAADAVFDPPVVSEIPTAAHPAVPVSAPVTLAGTTSIAMPAASAAVLPVTTLTLPATGTTSTAPAGAVGSANQRTLALLGTQLIADFTSGLTNVPATQGNSATAVAVAPTPGQRAFWTPAVPVQPDEAPVPPAEQGSDDRIDVRVLDDLFIELAGAPAGDYRMIPDDGTVEESIPDAGE
jgi:hypothetical protein